MVIAGVLLCIVAGVLFWIYAQRVVKQENRAQKFIMERIGDVHTKYAGEPTSRVEQYIQPDALLRVCKQGLKMPDEYLGPLLIENQPRSPDWEVDIVQLATYLAVVNALPIYEAKVAYGHVISGHGSIVLHSEPRIWLEFYYEGKSWIALSATGGTIVRADRFYNGGVTIGGRVNLNGIQSYYSSRQ